MEMVLSERKYLFPCFFGGRMAIVRDSAGRFAWECREEMRWVEGEGRHGRRRLCTPFKSCVWLSEGEHGQRLRGPLSTARATTRGKRFTKILSYPAVGIIERVHRTLLLAASLLHSHDAELAHAEPRGVHAPAFVNGLLEVRKEAKNLLLFRDVVRNAAPLPRTAGYARTRGAWSRALPVPA